MRLLKSAAPATSTALFLLDAAGVALAWPLALWITLTNAGPGASFFENFPSDLRLLLHPAANLLLLYAMGLYRRDAILETRRSLARVPLVVGMGAAIGSASVFLLPMLSSQFPPLGRPDQVVLFALAMVCFVTAAFAVRILFFVLLRRRLFRRHLMVLGAGRRALDLFMMLGNEGTNLHYDITFVHDCVLGEVEPRLACNPGCRIVDSNNFRLLEIAESIGADQIVIAPDERRGMRLESLLECKKAGFPVVQYLSFIEREIRRVDIKRLELSWIVYSDGFYFGFADRLLKKLLDVLVSAVMLVATSPFLLLSAAAIRWEGRGPIFYHQERVTQDGRVFRIVKLRTMRTDAEKNGAVWAATADDRITRVGRFLRRSRLDEIPQLWNVLKGDMSLVGPRPERPVFIAELASHIPLYNERHMVKAGLTGWAQINYPYGASIDDARSKLSYDLYYVKNFSILFDLLILLQTLRVVLFPSGVR
ncbi:MAG TPA: TIGR03013 family XrtA/PEP-CTERM system glycosyltransferase [Acetobacteraceae bacterium]